MENWGEREEGRLGARRVLRRDKNRGASLTTSSTGQGTYIPLQALSLVDAFPKGELSLEGSLARSPQLTFPGSLQAVYVK